ncbi:hypothetical protein ACOSOMT5_P2452 [Acidiphilium sp. MT5]
MSLEDEFSAHLTSDITWRVRELSEIVRACGPSADNDILRAALLRASVPLMYAHWEGYFVKASNSYLNFLAEKRTLLSAMRDEFWALSVIKRFQHANYVGDEKFRRFLISIRSDPDRSLKKGSFNKINGRSNLSSSVLVTCCEMVGLSPSFFEPYFEFIDNNLIVKRNFIAHGESLRFSSADVGPYRDKVVELMRITFNQFDNAVTRELYLRAPPH